jgi:hypothetical protein
VAFLFDAKSGSVAGERRKHNHEGHEGSRSFDWAMVPSGVVGCWVGEDRQRELLLMRGVPFTLSALPFKIEDKADVAQLVEQPIRNRQVSGSSPLVGSILSSTCHPLSLHPQFDLAWFVTWFVTRIP